jgi:hypothetical protein
MTGSSPMRTRALAPLRQVRTLGILMVVLAVFPALARDAAFIDPGAGNNSGAGDDAIKVEPKNDIDIGESVLNVPRRTTLFFVNQTSVPIQVEKSTVNGDGNVTVEITNDDCAKQGTLLAQSRCSIEVSVTPTSPGVWSVEVLMTHSGAGRIARAKVSGKTSGATSAERKDTGLALSAKDNKPVEFGDVDAAGGKAVRSALMINDSPDPITIYSIDVIEADNGLTRLDQGCAVDMELKPGESCPVTLVWTPIMGGQISTDLIIRHSGRLGFAVIPIRGSAKGAVLSKDEKGDTKASSKDSAKNSSSLPVPPTADDLARVSAGKIAAVPLAALGGEQGSSGGSGSFRLIGTVGNRVVLLKPDGTTVIADVGDDIDVDTKKAKVLAVGAKSADIMYQGKKKTLLLGAAPELIGRTKNTALSMAPSELLIPTPSNAGSLPSPIISATPLPTSMSAAPAPAPTMGYGK